MSQEIIAIDGALGEGGGQILRTSLSLSLCLGRAFRISHLRAARDKPGLRPQHLAAVKAAAEIGNAEVEGAEVGSPTLRFVPGEIVPGEYHFDVGTAGSATLVLQTVLPALLTGTAPSRVEIVGGTHNPKAPPFDFIDEAFLPLINRMGPKVRDTLERPGFYPRGGGSMSVTVEPVEALQPLELLERGPILERQACASVARLPEHIAERELAVVARGLDLTDDQLAIRHFDNAYSPGNFLTVAVRSQGLTELFTGIGERGLRAEVVAERVVRKVRRYLDAGVPVGERLADQLLLPLALAGGGAYRTLRPSLHTTTNIEVIRHFLPIPIGQQEIAEDEWQISLG